MKRTMVVLAALAAAYGQSAPPQPGAASGSVIRIDVNLVQVDAVVTDSKGRRPADLPASAFEVLQDGKPQAITNFAFVSTKPADERAAARAVVVKPAKGEVPPPPLSFRPDDVRRTLAIIVDDMGIAAENIPAVRSAIRSFLDTKMRPGDLVAIVRTGAGMGALQQFTSDKRLLYAALERVKYGESRVGVSSFAPLGSGGGRGAAQINHFREESLAVGSLGAIRFVVNSMRGYPGRKSAILFTENIRMIYRGTSDEMVASEVQRLSDAASRAAVVIHAIDPRGLVDFNLTPADNTQGMSRRRVSRVPAQRQEEMISTQQGSFVLAEQTGGLFLQGTSDLAGALRKAADDSDGYYLIGYHPDAGTFEDKNGQARFHRIEVKVKGAGLHVRSRDGFFGEPGAGDRPAEHTRQAEIIHALQSPFLAGPIHPRLTAVFENLRQTGSEINALLYFNPMELKWTTEADGKRKAAVDVAAAAFDDNGLALAPIDTTFTLQLTPKEYEDAGKTGLVYTIHVPVTKVGPYLVRAALRDPATESAGSVQQYVEVPDVESGRLAVSGILLQEGAAARGDAPQAATWVQDLTGGAARRIFHPGTTLLYGYEIINAKVGADKRPDLDVETRMYRAGVQVSDTKTALEAKGEFADPGRLKAEGRMALGRGMAAGEYVLQVIVTDKNAKQKSATVTQWTDFEIQQGETAAGGGKQ